MPDKDKLRIAKSILPKVFAYAIMPIGKRE